MFHVSYELRKVNATAKQLRCQSYSTCFARCGLLNGVEYVSPRTAQTSLLRTVVVGQCIACVCIAGKLSSGVAMKASSNHGNVEGGQVDCTGRIATTRDIPGIGMQIECI